MGLLSALQATMIENSHVDDLQSVFQAVDNNFFRLIRCRDPCAGSASAASVDGCALRVH